MAQTAETIGQTKIRNVYMAVWGQGRKPKHAHQEVVDHPELFIHLRQLWRVRCSGAALSRALIRHGNDKAKLVYENLQSS